MAGELTARDDLQTLLQHVTNGILAANLPNFTAIARPKVIQEGHELSTDASGNAKSGVITLFDMTVTKIRVNEYYHHERSFIPMHAYIEKMVASTDITKLIKEIERVLRVASQSLSRSYKYSLENIQVSSNKQMGSFSGEFILIKEYVDSTG